MDSFLQLNKGTPKKPNQKRGILPPSHISVARIEKLKKTFQPFWMREMLSHQNGEQNSLNTNNALNQI
jgi:hypothetical protein